MGEFKGPYFAEFGAIHHEVAGGFLFTVSDSAFAEDVAYALNAARAAPALLEALEELLFEDSGKPEEAKIATRLKARAAIAQAIGGEA